MIQSLDRDTWCTGRSFAAMYQEGEGQKGGGTASYRLAVVGWVPGFGKLPLWSWSWSWSLSWSTSSSSSSTSPPIDLRVDRSGSFSVVVCERNGCCHPSSPSLLQFDEREERVGLAGVGLERGVEGTEATHQWVW